MAWRPEVARVGKMLTFGVVWKNDRLRGNFQNSAPKAFTASPSHVLCANFVKFGRREIGKVVRYLPDKKTKFRFALSLLYVSHPKSAGQATDNVLTVLQMSSKSVYFQRSHSWTHEHIETRQTVFPIFGWSLASSQIKIETRGIIW